MNILFFDSNETIEQLMKQAFIRIYPPDGFSSAEHITMISVISKRPYFNWLTLVAAFIGWPCRQTRLGGEEIASREMTFWDLWLNFLGVNTVGKLSTGEWIWQFLIKPCFFIPLYSLRILLRLPISVVTLFTELLPLMIIAACVFGIGRPLDWGLKIASYLGLILAYPFLFIARSFTSPWNGLSFAWKEGDMMGGLLGSLTLFILSFICTTVVLFAFWPLVLQAVLPALAPSLFAGVDPVAIVDWTIKFISAAIFVDILDSYIFNPLSNWFFQDKDGGYGEYSQSTNNASSAWRARVPRVQRFAVLPSPQDSPPPSPGSGLDGVDDAAPQNLFDGVGGNPVDLSPKLS